MRNSERSSLATFLMVLVATVVRILFLRRTMQSVRVAHRIAYPMGVAIGWNASMWLRTDAAPWIVIPGIAPEGDNE